MKKEIISIDEGRGVFRVTTDDERWYTRMVVDDDTGLPKFEWRESVTWIAESYPKGVGFYKWLSGKGWDEAEALKQAAGEKGSKVHQAIERLILGEEIDYLSKFPNRSREPDSEGNYPMEQLSIEEWECLQAFTEWDALYNPKYILTEQLVESDRYGYAGTLDCVAQIGDQLYLIDWKTSQYVWPYMEIQLSAYKQALSEMGRNVENLKLAVLQVGYRGNRDKKDGTRTMWKFTEVPDQFDLFLAARQIHKKEHGNEKPKQKDYPIKLSIGRLSSEVKEEEPSVDVPGTDEERPKKKAIKKPKH